MASKKKDVKPIPVAVGVILVVLAFAAMAVFVSYLFSSGNGSQTDNSVEHSFTEESSDAPAPLVGDEKDYFADADVGDTVRFGRYDQDGDASNTESIEWQVLKKEEGRVLVMSRYALDTRVYNDERVEASWADSSLKKWLDESFYSAAFNDDEKTHILAVDNEGSSDKVFILSKSEAEELFEYASWRATLPTDTAKKGGARVQKNACWWWLRKNDASDSAPYVNFDGNIVSEFAVDYGKVAVRPVMWVSVETDETSASESSDSAQSDASE
jgi:hypothetical protein